MQVRSLLWGLSSVTARRETFCMDIKEEKEEELDYGEGEAELHPAGDEAEAISGEYEDLYDDVDIGVTSKHDATVIDYDDQLDEEPVSAVQLVEASKSVAEKQTAELLQHAVGQGLDQRYGGRGTDVFTDKQLPQGVQFPSVKPVSFKDSYAVEADEKCLLFPNTKVAEVDPIKVDFMSSVKEGSTDGVANATNGRAVYQQQSNWNDGSGGTMLLVGDLHWWITDAELEAALLQYGRVKTLKFFEERVSGKSRGYCQVEFFDPAVASMCKRGMYGRKFQGRPCTVDFADPKSIQNMVYHQERKGQVLPPRRTGGYPYQDKDGGRGFSRGGKPGFARGKSGYGSRSGHTVGSYGQVGSIVEHQPAMLMYQGVLGQGYDSVYGRGGVAAYGGYMLPGPAFHQSFPPPPLPGVAPHINPAFFGRAQGMIPENQGTWGEATVSGWVGSFEDGLRDERYYVDGSYGYGPDMESDRGRTREAWDQENEDGVEKRRRDDRESDWEREHYQERDRAEYSDRGRERDDWDRDRQSRIRSRTHMMAEEDEDRRLRRSVDFDNRKRRRTVDERVL